MSGSRANGQSAAPYDLEAATRAAANEAEAVPFAFTYKGESYSVPPSSEWPMPALAALAEGDLAGSLSQLLGDEAYDRLMAAGLKLGELGHLFEAVAGDSGMVTLPNSRPPQRRVSART